MKIIFVSLGLILIPLIALRYTIPVDGDNAKKVIFHHKSRPHLYRIRDGGGVGQPPPRTVKVT